MKKKKKKTQNSKVVLPEARKLFIDISTQIGGSESIANLCLDQIITSQNLTDSDIRSRFSELLQQLESGCYKVYLERENSSGEIVLAKYLSTKNNNNFPILNAFFLSLAQSRKSRAGQTFESIFRALFKRCGFPFEEQCIVNGKPDFLMPSESHYRKFPTDCLIFTAKRTLRERWRQIATEGTRGKSLYLATIDKEVSVEALSEMLTNRIHLVVPANHKALIPEYKAAPNVMSFEDFFRDQLEPAIKRWQLNNVI